MARRLEARSRRGGRSCSEVESYHGHQRSVLTNIGVLLPLLLEHITLKMFHQRKKAQLTSSEGSAKDRSRTMVPRPLQTGLATPVVAWPPELHARALLVAVQLLYSEASRLKGREWSCNLGAKNVVGPDTRYNAIGLQAR